VIDTTPLVTIVTAVLAAIPATLLALATLRQSIKNSVKADELNAKADTANIKSEQAVVKVEELSTKADDLSVKTAEIHVLANDNYARMQAQNKELTDRIIGLEKALAVLATAYDRELHEQALQIALNTHSPLEKEVVKPEGDMRKAVFDAIHSDPPIPVSIQHPIPITVIKK